MTNLDNLTRDIMAQFTEWTEDVTRSVDDEVKNTAEALRSDIRSNAPRKTGDYAAGWDIKKQSRGGQTQFIVYNKSHYRLTHLLEKGHAKRGGGRVAGIPHIEPAANVHIQQLVTNIQRIIRNGG